MLRHMAMRTFWGQVSLALACAVLSAQAGAAHAQERGPRTRESARLGIDQRFFRDELGRAVILRGVNARVQGLFDVTFDDGRLPLENIPELAAEDCRRMAELGLHVVRLPLNWSAIEPQKDVFDPTYLKRVDRAVSCLRREGIYTLLDLHQDAYSKEIGEDGAPLWAIVPPPEMLLGGPLGSTLLDRRLAPQTIAAFDSFFAVGDPSGLQAQFIEMLQYVAKHFANEEWVIGIDLFNEPFTQPEPLEPFNTRAAEAVRAVAPSMVLFFEPTGLSTFNGGEPVGARTMPVAGTMYGPHIYDIVLFGTEDQRVNLTRADLEPAFQRTAQEASDWGKPWMIGEFGAGPGVTNYEKYLTFHYDLQDEYLVSSALWLWKEDSQDAWGLFDRVNGEWVERPKMVNVVSRPHAVRIAGTPTRMQLAAGALTVAYANAFRAPNVLFIPERFRVAEVRCDGKVVAAKTCGTNLIEVSCGRGAAHELTVSLEPRTQTD